MSNNCIPTQLTNTADPIITCGVTGVMLNGTTTLWAFNVPGANRYQFTFANIPGQPVYNRNITSPSRSLQLFKWYTLPLKAGRTYRVRVRGSFDNGATWCDFGPICNISLSSNPGGVLGGSFNSDEASVVAPELLLFPNPNRDGLLTLNMEGLDVVDESAADIEVYDMLGQRVLAERAVAADGMLNHRMDLGSEIGAGLYMVNVSIDGTLYTQRLVIQ